ncbi:hypothetical protein OQA88_645 [Cercophora sp. LCS_1]
MSEPARKRRNGGQTRRQHTPLSSSSDGSFAGSPFLTPPGSVSSEYPLFSPHTTVPISPHTAAFTPWFPECLGTEPPSFPSFELDNAALVSALAGFVQPDLSTDPIFAALSSTVAPAEEQINPQTDSPEQPTILDGGEAQTADTLIGDIWTNTSLYRLDGGPCLESTSLRRNPYSGSKKRNFSQFIGDHRSIADPKDAFLLAEVPALFPSVPRIQDRLVYAVPNPFLASSGERHPTLSNRVRPAIPENGVINGYIKIQMRVFSEDEENSGSADLRYSRRRNSVVDAGEGCPLEFRIPLLPANFPTGMKLDKIEEKLWSFHINAFCPGRTLLKRNYWHEEIASIAVKDECVRHALLAFSTAYALDYQPGETLRRYANTHYAEAVRLLDQSLRNKDSYSAGKEDGVIAATIVNWESRRPKGEEPLWREGSRAARMILDRSDPGYRYYKSENVQCSRARRGNANWIAYTDICAQPVTPLTEENTQNLYSWLLAGSREQVHEIQDMTGVCSKLLHVFSQITHLAALMKQNPNSSVVPLAASKIKTRLSKMQQWCRWAEGTVWGYATAEELMNSCELDDGGKVQDGLKVTQLSAHAKPRSHPHVAKSLKVLTQCIERLPCTGKLFTSQSPFFPVFIMALVSYQEHDRQVSRDWFEVVLRGAQCRSSVPPVWEAIKTLWKWLDNDLKEDLYDEDQPIGERRAWWEEMVDELLLESGVLSLV